MFFERKGIISIKHSYIVYRRLQNEYIRAETISSHNLINTYYPHPDGEITIGNQSDMSEMQGCGRCRQAMGRAEVSELCFCFCFCFCLCFCWN